MNQVASHLRYLILHYKGDLLCFLTVSFFSPKDNYFEEAFKMRNVLEEFLKRRRSQRKPTILGLREHIFTGRSAFIIICLIIDWILMSGKGNAEIHSAG